MTNSEKKKNAMADGMAARTQVAIAGVKETSISDRFARAEEVATGVPRAAAPAGPPLPARFLPLDSIKDREQNLRGLNAAHVVELANSVAAVGLLQFPVVDQHNVLLAGGHRKAAIEALHVARGMDPAEVRTMFSTDPEDPLSDEDIERLCTAYERQFAHGVPVRVLNTEGLNDDDINLRIEAIENEHRLDFTKPELAGIVDRLKAAGYKDTPGRPREGQRVLSRELERIMNKSRRTVFRLLQELRENPSKSSKSDGEKKGLSPASKSLAEDLTQLLGTKVRIRDGEGQQGSIIIEYASFKERADLVKALGKKK